MLMGQIRPMKVDDVAALVSWIFVGHLGFILIGTTTFVSVVLLLVNSFSFEEYFAKTICERLTRYTGYNVFFETAIVPRWRNGSIRLENVKIICNDSTWIKLQQEDAESKGLPFNPADIDVNFSYWDLSVESIDLTLSLWQWFDGIFSLIVGKGVISAAKYKGVRGTCDRAHLTWPEDYVPTRRIPQFGDFELSSFIVEDMLITVKNANFRPFTISIFQAILPLFRKQWMLYDTLTADSIVGTYDECLFSVHKPQTKDLRAKQELNSNWSKLSNLKLYGLPMEHFQSGVGISGPLKWIQDGKIDLDLNFLVPHTSYDDDLLDKILDEVDGLRAIAVNKVKSVLTPNANTKPDGFSLKDMRHYGLRKKEDKSVSVTENPLLEVHPEANIVMIWSLKIKDIKASVPIGEESLSYMSNALIRPVVGYLNGNHTLIPLSLTAQMDVVQKS